MLKLHFSRILPALALILVFGWAAWERFRLPCVPFAVPDVWAYLGPGLDTLLGKPFHEWFGQCFLYPFFLYVMLEVTNSFCSITLVQGVLGLATGALLYVSWMELRCFLPQSRLPAFVFRLAGVTIVAVYLLSTATVEFERTLRPEAVFPFVVVLQIYCNLRFVRIHFVSAEPGRAIISGGCALFLSVMASLLKPSFSGAILLVNLPVIISLFQRKQSLGLKLFLIGLPLIAATLLLIWPERRLRVNSPSPYLMQSLFSIHADLIDRQIADDLTRNTVTPYPREFLAAAHMALSKALRESEGEEAKYWPALGFNPDYLRLGKPGKASFLQELPRQMGSVERSNEFCRNYYWRAMRGQWRGTLAKIARQFAAFYHPGRCPAYAIYPSLNLADEYRRSSDSLAGHPDLLHYPPGATLLASVNHLANDSLQIGPYKFTARITQRLSKTHFYWCLWTLFLALCVWRIRALRAVFGTIVPVVLLLYAYNLGIVFSLAIGHSLDVTRYSQYQFAFVLLPELGSVWLAAEFLIFVANQFRARRRIVATKS